MNLKALLHLAYNDETGSNRLLLLSDAPTFDREQVDDFSDKLIEQGDYFVQSTKFRPSSYYAEDIQWITPLTKLTRRIDLYGLW